MAGTKAGAQKAAKTRIDKYGKDFYSKIGKVGGMAKVPKGFAMNKKLASEMGRRKK